MGTEAAPRGAKFAGFVMFNRLGTDGLTYGGWRRFPNVATLSITSKSKTETLISTAPENAGSAIDSYSEMEPATGKLSVNQIEHRSTLSAVLLGLDETLTRASAADTASVAMPSAGVYAEIGHAGLSGVTITQPNTSQNGTGEAGVLVYRKSGTPTITYVDSANNNEPLAVAVSTNDISVTLATDASSNPISTAAEVVAAINAHSGASALIGAVLLEDSDGSGVVAAKAQATLAGGGVLVADTDYTLLSELGMFTRIAGGAALVGVPQAVAFTKNAQAGFTISANRVSAVRGKLQVYLQNKVGGKSWKVEANKVLLSPDGDLNLMGSDAFAVASWAVTLEVPAGQLASYDVKVW